MKKHLGFLLVLIGFLLPTLDATADQVQQIFGGDVYVSGSRPELTVDAPRDAFAAGFSVTVDTTVGGDLHLAGFDIESRGRVVQDLYAAGASISVRSAVGQDLTIAGFSIELEKGASVAGNARIAGGSVDIAAPIAGNLLVSAGDVDLDATISGDVKLTAGNVSFGPQAKIIGNLTYSSPKRINIPASVITPERVSYTPISHEAFGDISDTISESVKSPWPAFATMLGGFVVTLVFFLIVGALFLSYAPESVARLRAVIQTYPGKSLLAGFVGLATLVGLIPLSLITMVGIPLIPLVILACFVVWMLGYLLGVYALSMKVASAFTAPAETAGGKLLVLAIGITVLTVLNFIPIGGWLLNLAIVLLGVGAMTAALMNRVRWFAVDPAADGRMGQGG